MTSETTNESKKCPECLEDVNLLAIKCSHCGSIFKDIPSLVRHELALTNGKIVYVLDKDLIRFVKFTTSIIIVFALLGLYLFGIDLKTTREDMEDGQQYIEQVRSSIENDRIKTEKLNSNFRLIEAELLQYKESAKESAKEAEETLKAILLTQNKVKVIHTQLSRSKEGEFKIISKTLISDNEPKNKSNRGKLWPVGHEITVSFLDGNLKDQNKVEKWAHQWEKYANIKFKFIESNKSDIRISFDKNNGSWAHVGLDNIDIPNDNESTMNLGWIDEATVLHQFGHVLGLVHEHQIPMNDIPWNKEKVYDFFGQQPNNWSKKTIDKNVLQSYSIDTYPIAKTFDKNSIMLYSFPKEILNGSYSLNAGNKISVGDREFISKLYPK